MNPTGYNGLMGQAVKELTYGQKAVGLTFNHAEGDLADTVHKIKQLYADIIDELYTEVPLPNEEVKLREIAIMYAQGAQMWAVKAITWKD